MARQAPWFPETDAPHGLSGETGEAGKGASRPSFPRGAAPARSPHPATIMQRRPAVGAPPAKPPHPATVAQPRPGTRAAGARPPHPATLQRKPAAGAQAARPPGPAVAQRSKGNDLEEELEDVQGNPGFWYTGEREQVPPPMFSAPPIELFVQAPRGKKEYDLALDVGKKRYQTLIKGPQDTINPGVSLRTWNVYKGYYESKIEDRAYAEETIIVTRFKAAKGERDVYENYFSTRTGTIVASHNFRSKEEKEDPEHALSGSEVIFRQIILMEDTTGRPFILRVLKRKSVVNPAAQALISYLRKKNGKNAFVVSDINDFYALLGTENGTAATYLVHDHGFYLGVCGISEVRITKEGSIEFEFTPGRMGR